MAQYRVTINNKKYSWTPLGNMSIAKMQYISSQLDAFFGNDWYIEFKLEEWFIMKYEVWLYDRMIAQTLVYDLAYEIFKGMCKKHRTTPCWIVHIESGEIIDKFNFD